MREALIDVTRLVGRFARGRIATGVDRVCVEYVRRYGPESRAIVRWAGADLVLHKSESKRLFDWLLAPGTRQEAYATVARGALWGAASPVEHGAVLFNPGHSGLERACYESLREKNGARPFFVVHDLIPITHPQYNRAGEREKHMERMRNVLAYGRVAIASSQATLDELAQFARSEKLPMPEMRVVPLAPGLSPVAAGPAPRGDAYFVVVGTIEPRKNHKLLLEVWERLVARLGPAAPTLVVIGQRGWECDDIVEKLERGVASGHVVELAKCSDADLANYLHHARALLFPTFVEGYGMPLVEALVAGVPAIASDLRVFREVAGDVPDYASPTDVAAWEALVSDYAQPKSARRDAQVQRLGGFKAPTWDAHFAQVDALLGELDG